MSETGAELRPVAVPAPTEKAVRFHQTGNWLWAAWQLWALAGTSLVVALVVWQTSFTGAQNPENGGKKAPESPLPIRQVVLFNSGVGYFQREGEGSGDAQRVGSRVG